MKYAKKVVYVPFTGDTYLTSLDQKMSKILSQKIPIDEKVKLYNHTLETYLLNVPEKSDPKDHLHEEDKQFLVEKPAKLDLKDKQFLIHKVKKAVKSIIKQRVPSRLKMKQRRLSMTDQNL